MIVVCNTHTHTKEGTLHREGLITDMQLTFKG